MESKGLSRRSFLKGSVVTGAALAGAAALAGCSTSADAAANPSKFPAGLYSIGTGSYQFEAAHFGVDGVYTADPRKDPTATLLDHVTYAATIEEISRVDHCLGVIMSMPSAFGQ